MPGSERFDILAFLNYTRQVHVYMYKYEYNWYVFMRTVNKTIKYGQRTYYLCSPHVL